MNELQKRENDLVRELEQARQEYDASARAVAIGDSTADQAAIRARITTIEGELVDVRAAIQGGERIESEKQIVAARKQRIRSLTAAAQLIDRRNELAPLLVSRINALGETYREFVQAGTDARTHAMRADRSRRTFEGVDTALGVQQGIDQLLAGLLDLTGLRPVMQESGVLWASKGPSFVDIQVQRSTRAATVVRHQIEQETSNVETPLSSHRSG
jgi:hypothetical protein